jgi:hypothetical protein
VAEIFFVFVYAILFSLVISRGSFFRNAGLSNRQLLFAFACKIAAGCLLGYLYTFHYPDRLKADTLKFFDDSKVIFDLLKTHPVHFLKIMTGLGAGDPVLTPTYLKLNSWMYEEFMNSNRTMIRIDVLFRFLSPGNYYFVHVVMVNFLSFTGLVYCYRLLAARLSLNRRVLYLTVFFVPSLVFWGSGLLKEAILLLALGVFLYHALGWLDETGSNWKKLLPLALSGLLLVFIKPYIPLILFPLLLAYAWVEQRPSRRLVKYAGSSALFFLLLFHLYLVLPRYNLSHYLFIKQRDFLDLVRTEKPGSAIDIPRLTPEFSSMVRHAPRGWLTTLTRPWPFESRSPLILLASVENLVLLLALALCLARWKPPLAREVNFVLFSLGFVSILFILIGLVTPVEGAIVRYKCVALPFLLLALFSMTRIRIFRHDKADSA